MPNPQQTILIIENHDETRKTLTENALAFGFGVEVCDSCEAGWVYFQKEFPRLVIIEGYMPDDAALTLCRQIRESTKGSYCTILMVANQHPANNQMEALMAGVSYCMDKPIQEGTLTGWLTIAKHSMDNLLAMEQNLYKQELENVNDQLGNSIARANQLAMDAEMAYIEINQVFKTVSGGIAVISTDYEIIRHNENYLTMSEATASEVKIRKCHELSNSSLCNTPDCPLTKIIKGQKRVESQIEKVLSNGEKIYHSVISTPFYGLIGELLGMVEHITDITPRIQAELALKESETRYKELSIVDELTGLFNRRHFNEILHQEIGRAVRYSHPLSMLIMDIDNFKHFNDTYGHTEGDHVLAIMGQILAKCIRSFDHSNRYGGEEFTVILPDTTREVATIVAERIRQNFAAYCFYPRNDEKVNKTVSIGITQFLIEDTPDSFLKRADKNLYQAKKAGKNRYVIDSYQ